MTRLERSYRALMRAYPSDYRSEHEEEIVSTLLDAAGTDQRPALSTAASILVHGSGYRLRAIPEASLAARDAGLTAGSVGYSRPL